MATLVQTKFDVGGVLLDRPFKIRRLGHFGFNMIDMEGGLRFYVDLLGFRISDTLDWAARVPDPKVLEGLGVTRGYFLRYGTDHHSMVLFPKRVLEAMRPDQHRNPEVTINQITWQVGSLEEIVNAITWFNDNGVRLIRSGRDMPGSNWHTYLHDLDDHTNELYYGMEQIGWQGYSKPLPMHNRRFTEPPTLPQISELEEVQQALAAGVDLESGYRYVESLPATYNVEGVLLPRPFKIVREGPVGLFVHDVAAAAAFYREKLGFTVSEEVVWSGHRCMYLRATTEHHSLALYPRALREALGFSPHTTSMSFGLQLGSYRQLRNAVSFLKEHGVRFVDVPPELHPGIDYAAYAVDPDGHTLQLYYYMEKVGWQGQVRPRELRRPVNGEWPEAIEPLSDTFAGEPFMGPLG